MELEIEEEPVVKETVTPNPPVYVTEDIPVDEQLDEESTASNPIVSKSVLCSSTRNKQKPNRYGYNLTVVSTEQQDPSSVAKPDPSLTKSSGKGPWKEK